MTGHSDTLTLLACQIDIPPMTTATERDAHLVRSSQAVADQLSRKAADVVVLPELSSIDYSRDAFRHLDVLAEDLDGPSFACWSRFAQVHGVFVSYSFARRTSDTHHITVAVVNPQGDLVGHFDKLHLAQYGASMEKEYFSRGNHLMAFDVRGFRLAPFICYDIRFPELSRHLAVELRADVILHCGAYFRDASFHTWHPFAITRAMENQVYFLSLNRAGVDYGNSIFCLPWMDEKTEPLRFENHDEDFRFVTVNRAIIEQARQDYTFLKDRLDTYARPCSGIEARRQ
jgi:nitrilase